MATTTMNDISSTNKISSAVTQRLPDFVKVDHPTFVSFIGAYYEWLETQGSYLRSPMDLKSVGDVDTTFSEFVNHFKEQYLLDFPEALAINSTTGTPVDPRILIKNIKAFYRAKGTEKTYEFLFRILYDTNVEFYYPKVDLLKLSDGKWIEKKTIRTTSTLGKTIFDSIGKTLYQKNAVGTINASAPVTEISRFQLGTFELTEITVGRINGSFVTNQPVYFINDDGTSSTEARVFSVVSSISVSSGGSGYRVGDKVVFTNASGDVGQGAKAKVSSVSATGKILKVKIENFGLNYDVAPTITITSEKGSGFSGTVSVGSICNFEGYYANSDGKLSSNKVIQDSHYYQNYSYVLKTEVTIDRYKETIKRLIHPAGLGFFGQILIKRCAAAELDMHSALIRYEVPRIGHYAPYTFQTFDNLGQWFISGGTAQGYGPGSGQDDLISGAGGNPISNGIAFQAAFLSDTLKGIGFPRGDPYWFIYNHPNTRIKNTVIAKIDSSQKWDFLGTGGASGWSEWTMTGATEKSQWSSGFTGDYKYALLKYSTSTEFRKITARSFFTMPVGDEFDCRLYNGVGNTHSPYGSWPNSQDNTNYSG